MTVECRGLNPILNPLFIYYSDAANLEFVSLFTDVSQIQSIQSSEAALTASWVSDNISSAIRRESKKVLDLLALFEVAWTLGDLNRFGWNTGMIKQIC